MRANTSDSQDSDTTTATQPVTTTRLRWLDLLSKYRQPLGLAITLLLFAIALIACRHLLSELDFYALHDSILEVPKPALLGALGATIVGFIILLGYEWSASRYAGVNLPGRTLALGGFTAFAIGNAIGLSLLSGGSVRYRLYARHGLGASDVAHMTLFASLSLGCALPPLAALATLSNLPAASAALRLPESLLAGIALAILLLGAVLAVGIYRRRLPEQPLRDNLLVRVGRRTLRLPGRRLTFLQLIITALDVAAAATVLYLLLPEAPPFGAFLLVYLLALAAGVLSHVPGGVGVFEAILLAAFADKLGAAPLAAALLLYRLIYVVLPMLVACILLLINEAQRLFQTRQSLRVASGLAAPILAVLVFLSGVVLLFSGATPEIDTRLQHIGFLIPHRLVDASHFGASLIGVLCLLLAQGLRRRLSAAWMLTTILLLVGALLSLLKGFDWEEACLMTLTASLLAVFRRSFYRPSRLTELPFSPLYLVASVCVLGASTWLLLFAYQDVPYSHQLWWQFTLDADAPRGLRSLLGAAVLLLVVSLTWLLRTARPVIHLPTSDELDKAAKILMASSQPDGGLALTGDKALLFHPNDDAFLMYARRGRSLVALYDPIGPTQQRAEMIWQFRDLCDLHHARPVFYQVRAENLPYYMDIGLTAIKLGEEARVDLKRFDLEAKGKEMKDLRYTWNRGTRDGLSLEIHEPGQAPMDELKVISDAWLTGKNVREKGFSLGRFSDDYLKHFRIAIIRFEGRPVAFANLLETYSHDLASLDLMRAHPDAPKLTMEFMMVGLIQHYKNHGYARFSLGMVPLSGLQPRRGAPLTQRLGSMVFRRGEQLYNFQGLRRFKDKFQPDWEPRYMAVPAGLDPLVALADTAALIAGGLTGLVKR
ncbi:MULTISPECIES: bifunctional lysylphosphatidylglycerol flippase/synthetase MprF [Pseudomonas]|uniref:bifunctional lysylphosphatidylglycerol flippase/synthetase MprF n=1 Tax=Pseudomonas TaxID=286 RepID=UPI00209804BE|nr:MULTISPECIES: bifunctional lysylphosphatidylglycerol flippase/synthetase MprF [Pseudomonas]MCO7576045.1 bifunctional lysylphosphatidylglycerol flippase/synthetase MprF [Pseudomonas protegens]MCO7581117.1 bifunctional lysylphosphatidylglycerol flippase/synthetase MprF [Pseudomonas chlororaphis]MCO7597858.1 bifunctional lysylphosphatidylglycerol flippase/synthetase MprF [Pseudomonas chlororaphis]MDC7813546.1 bifunctional lysylphosphatidylglycerol flippase/synthetase MprF [Pseudomonas sp. BLCC-